MDITTGEIRNLSEKEVKEMMENTYRDNFIGQEEINKLRDCSLIPIDINDATEKQKENMCVSLNDHKSKLGKKLTKARCENGVSRKKRRNKRRGK